MSVKVLTVADDTYNVLASDNQVFGLTGTDIIRTNGAIGSHSIYAGEGAKFIGSTNGTPDQQFLYGGFSDIGQTLSGGANGDFLFAGGEGWHLLTGGVFDFLTAIVTGGIVPAAIAPLSGDDFLYGGVGQQTSIDGGLAEYGFDGNDVLFGSDYSDSGSYLGFMDGGGSILAAVKLGLFGGDGNDQLYGGNGSDLLNGGTGADYLNSGNGLDSLYGGDGADQLFSTYTGLTDRTYMQGDAGNDYLQGANNNDALYGGADIDTVYGGGGADYIQGDVGNDYVEGGDGADNVYGGADNDTVYGGGGGDYIDGNDGNDYVAGGDGNDVVYGGTGNDTVSGGFGNDTIGGGTGTDIFDLRAEVRVGDTDYLYDVSAAEGDKIDLPTWANGHVHFAAISGGTYVTVDIGSSVYSFSVAGQTVAQTQGDILFV